MASQLAERDPISEALVSRFVMLFIGLLFIVIVSILNFVLTNIFNDFLATTGVTLDAWHFLFYLVATVISLPLIASLKHIFQPRENQSLKSDIFKQFSVYSIAQKNVASQLKHALLIWLLFFVPLDFLSYLIPGMLEFQANSLYQAPSGTGAGQGLYFIIPAFWTFLCLSIIVHFLVAAREETLYRGVFQFWGQECVGMTSAVMISAIFFGFSHFSYWFANLELSILFPLWWGLSGLLVGFVLGFYLRSTGHIWPMILAHWGNNVVSTIAIWMYFTSGNVSDILFTLSLWLYLPLIGSGLILAVFWRKTLKIAVKLVKKDTREYISQPPYNTFFDILFGIGMWIILLVFGA